MEKILNTRHKTKKDTQANWESANPVLLDGEEILVVCSDGEIRKKIGDGTSTYSALPFSTFGLVTKDELDYIAGIDVKRILMYGLVYDTKTISEDGTVIVSTDSDGLTLTETFSNDFNTRTSVLTDSSGPVLGRLVKTTSSDGTSISSSITLENIDSVATGYRAAVTELDDINGEVI